MSSATRRLAATLAAALLAVLAAATPTVAVGPAVATAPRAGSTSEVGLAAPAASKPTPSPAPSGSAAGTDAQLATFGISPATATAPDGRSFVIIGAAPGSVVTDNVAILNQSDMALPLAVYPSEATTAADGSLTLANRDAVADAGAWLSLRTSQVQVPPQSSKGIGFVVVPLTVRIPTDAEPGDHVAAVMASLTTVGQGGANSPNLKFEQRVGARIYITVDGPVKPALTVTHLRTTYDRGPLWGLLGQGKTTVTYILTNTGNVRMAVRARSTSSGPFGLLPSSTAGAQINELLPKGTVTQKVVVHDVWPLVWTTTTVQAAVGAAPGGKDVTLAPVVAAQGVWTVPWLWLAVLVLVLLVVFRRRLHALAARLPRRRTRRGRHAGDATPTTPVADASGTDDDVPTPALEQVGPAST